MSSPGRRQAAKLACEAVPALYADIADLVVPVLADEFLVPGSELSGAIAIADDQVRGLIAAYPAEEYSARQRVSLHHALTELSPADGKLLINQLSLLASKVPKGAMHGQYLARFTVAEGERGTGVADAMMAVFLEGGSEASLHVQADNARAIAFYRRHGFTETAATIDFLLMSRP